MVPVKGPGEMLEIVYLPSLSVKAVFPIIMIARTRLSLSTMIVESETDTVADATGKPVDESVTVPVMIPHVHPVLKVTEIDCEAVWPY